jgi:hypothetical protein
MKRVMWESMGVENSISAKAHLSSFEQLQNTGTSELTVCAGKSGSLWNDAELMSTTPVKLPLLLFFALLIFPWALFRYFSQSQSSYSSFFYFFPYSLPIYLKLRRLIYYF